jgi:hypothetical protein
MGLLIKPFTLSFVKDGKRFTIGSDTMTSQNKASSVSLKRNINGSKSLSFKMYYRYKDTITGEDRKNPYTDEDSDINIRNEDTLHLLYKGKNYYFVVKNITKNSSDYSCTFSAEDKGV